MRTQYIENPNASGNVLHNGKDWQVTEMMSGLCCELLHKERVLSPAEQREWNLSNHGCYPSVLLQGDDSAEFLRELENAQKKLTPAEIGRLFLDSYRDVVRL
jgi:hypothetical protein